MPPARKALIVFMRYPEAGRVKSRLAASIGAAEAARIYEVLVRRTLGVVSEFLAANPKVHGVVSFSPGERRAQVESKFAGPWGFMPQEGSHLGECMGNADMALRAGGFEHVVLVGSDVPDLDSKDLSQAFAALDQHHAVLGPASDGGFYLIGLGRPCSVAFAPETWGTSEVLRRTEGLLRIQGLPPARTRCLSDLDDARDLHLLDSRPFLRDRLSVIVPTIDFGPGLTNTLDSLQDQLWPDDEVIVAQGGNAPPPGLEEGTGRVRVIRSPRGRGLQLNAGAVAAGGNLLLFLHDDSLPPAGFPFAIRRACANKSMAIGCFQLQFSPTNPALDLVARWANFRSRHLRLPYGDQGLFCRKDFFDSLEGFKRPYLMEDVDLVTRFRRHGKVVVLPSRIKTSSERYLRKGVLRASMQNHLLMFMYLLGVDERRLYRIYYGLHRSD